MDFISKYTLDARPDRIDLRDKPYNPPLVPLNEEWPEPAVVENHFPAYIKNQLILNQGHEGACTGFGLACTINYLFWRKQVVEQQGKAAPKKVSERMLYHLARFYDEWPGEDYSGSSCRGAIKAWHKHGVCSQDCWPYQDKAGNIKFIKPRADWHQDAALRPLGVYYRVDRTSLTQMQAAIQETGAIYVSANIHRNWNIRRHGPTYLSHAKLPLIPWEEDTEPQGGHAFALVGYNRRGFIVQNSWGENWGAQGFAVMTYQDWFSNGTDAWVFSLGAPTERNISMPTYYSPKKNSGTAPYPKLTAAAFRPDQARQEHEYANESVRPWNEQLAYEHSVVLGNNGRVIPRLVEHENARACVHDLAVERPAQWLKSKTSGARHVVIYAHGGLNSEEDSVERIRIMAPYFKANSIYPLFLTWRTGLGESLISIMGDALGRLAPTSEGSGDFFSELGKRAAEARDRTLEVACESLGVKAIWSQMKQNAEQAAGRGDDKGGLAYLVDALTRLDDKQSGLKIHLVGHSAGSILLGHLLTLARRKKLKVSSCTLYAPACTVEFANQHYVKAVRGKVLLKRNFHIHLLNDERELADSVGPYGKSLLYLVSRALENGHKTPLLGLANIFDKDKARDDKRWSKHAFKSIREWNGFWRDSENLYQVKAAQVTIRARFKDEQLEKVLESTDSTHGSFDNDISVVGETLRRIRGRKLMVAVENLRY